MDKEDVLDNIIIDTTIETTKKHFPDEVSNYTKNLGEHLGKIKPGMNKEAQAAGRATAKMIREEANTLLWDRLHELEKIFDDKSASIKNKLDVVKFYSSIGIGQLKTIEMNDKLFLEAMINSIAVVFKPDEQLMQSFKRKFEIELISLSGGHTKQ